MSLISATLMLLYHKPAAWVIAMLNLLLRLPFQTRSLWYSDMWILKKADDIIEKYIKTGELLSGIIPVNYETIDKK
jgi:hypothetical protein